MVSASNPLRSYADTTAYEQAFRKLDLLVTSELAMTETAVLSHYVLPARSGYESWDGIFFAHTYPGIYFQMRRPIIEPEGEPLEAGEIHLRLADRLGLIPPIPESLYKAAEQDRAAFGAALMAYVQKEPAALKVLPFIVGKTLGKVLGSAHLASALGHSADDTQELSGKGRPGGIYSGTNSGRGDLSENDRSSGRHLGRTGGPG